MKLLVTNGAKKNVGDYLIHGRGIALLRHLRPDIEIASVRRWIPTDLVPGDRMLLTGGPGITSQMSEWVFPIAEAARQQGMALSSLALGWSGLPAKAPTAFGMSDASLELLRAAAVDAPIGVRDDLTLGIVERLGVPVIRTGCTAWYSIPDLGAPARIAGQPRRIVFTTPANARNTGETIRLMRALRRLYPTAELIAAFHRGIGPDAQTPLHKALPLMAQAAAARALGYRVEDVSYDLAKIDFYRDADLHVGYRVHAHLCFVSQRLPSLLISEDGRGSGQAVTLGGADSVIWAGDGDVPATVIARLEAEQQARWPSLDQAIGVIEDTWPVMRDAVLAIRS